MTAQTTEIKLINLTIDGKAVSVPKGTTVWTACRNIGIDIPIFCYQDRMPPFGACRVCLVEVEKAPKLQTSCTLECTEGMVVKTQSQMAVDGRRGILEFLLINHPLDCPICDRGGECPLQEQTLKFGPAASRFFEDKRHFVKALSLGPVLKLDRERCIVCARCTRFGDVLAGDHALEFLDRGFKTEVGTPDGGPADSKFIGNTIMICPVGALTSEVYRFRARPWDNQPTNSTCTLCPVGCSLILDSRDGEIMRTRSREDKDVNDIWLCDKGWFGYEYTYSTKRLESPLLRRNGKLESVSWEEALSAAASKITEAKQNGKIAGWGGNPLTVEENYLFQKLLREGADTNNIDHRIGQPILELNQEGFAPGMEMTIGECEKLNYAIFFGLDLTEEFPVIWLRLRQAINHGAKVVFFGNFAPEISFYYDKTFLHAPGQEIETIQTHLEEINSYVQGDGIGAIFVGSQYLNNPNRLSALSEILKIKQKNPKLSLNIMDGRNNSVGARFAGMRPDSGPFGEKIEHPGLNALQVLEKASTEDWDVLYVSGANPAKKYPSKIWNQAREKTKFLIVQDLFLTETAQQADVVFPTLSYVEKGGTFINIEGRPRTLLPGKEIPSGLYSDAEIFGKMAQHLKLNLVIAPEFIHELQTERLMMKRPDKIEPINTPTQSKSGLRASFAHYLFDNGVRMKNDPHVIELAKEPFVRIHPSEAINRGLVDGQKVGIKTDKAKISGLLKFDKRVASGTVVLPLGFDKFSVQELGPILMNGLEIEITKEV